MVKKVKEQEQSLESILWNCRNELRGIGGTDSKRDAVIGLVFLKFAGDKFTKRRAAILAEYGDIPAFLEKPSFYLSENVFYLNEASRWEHITKNASAEDIAVIVDKVMQDIEDANPPLKGALPQNFYATLGIPKENFKGLLDEVSKIDEKRFVDEDLIGRVYEYFLRACAVAGDKEDGEFYTPACVVKLIAEIIEPYSGIVYDRSATKAEIAAQKYSLAPSKYIEFIDNDLEIDYTTEMARIQAKMSEIMAAEKKSQAMLEAAFRGIRSARPFHGKICAK
jgi:type I restriction enzyme M protein